MKTLAGLLDDFLRGRGAFAAEAPFAGRAWTLVGILVAGGFVYGAVMGSYSGLGFGRPLQILYSGIKVPFLLLVTFLLCLPSFYVLNAAAGLREDFPLALRAVMSTQGCVAVILAALAPLTAFVYLAGTGYASAVLVNGVMFAVASAGAQGVVKRYYGPLVARSPRHGWMKWGWLALYVFVGIQMGWVLRPFIGSPGLEVTFFRQGAWGNAYVVVLQVITGALQGR